MNRYGKRGDLLVHEQEPFNAETGPAALAEGPVTATDAFYVRGHAPVPTIDPLAWRLRVFGAVERELELSLEAMREVFAEREVTATLQCAGNRRAGLMAIREIPGEAPWGPGATGTARWAGVALADVLALARPLTDSAHVGFDGADVCEEAKPSQRFGGSIPIQKAYRPEVLLAWTMNGEPLPPVHGAPLRVVVPGYIGARSVKWLQGIELRSQPWQGYYQHVVYRLLAEEERPGPGAGMPLGIVALNSDVLSPADGATVPAGPVEVRGYAFAGGERYVARVDVSVDEQVTWAHAELLDDLGPWAWRQWRITIDLAPGEHEIVVRAWDSSAATQPESEAGLWNPKGYVNNARPRIRVTAVAG
jgi:sulfite oxidase